MLIPMAGLGSWRGMGTLEAFAQQIKRVEGYYPPGTPGYPNGSLAYQNNNPGNIRYTSYYASHFGATPGAGGYSRFPNYATGWAALQHQITLDANRGLTIREMMNKYAPAQDGNDPASYAATIAQALGVSVDTRVSSVIAGSPAAPLDVPAVEPQPEGEQLAGMIPDDAMLWVGGALALAVIVLVTQPST